MKNIINTVMYLLCASAVTCNISHATNFVKEYDGLYLDGFTAKCECAVRDIWEAMPTAKTTFELDFDMAEQYVDAYTRVSHQTGKIQNDFVKALYDQMKQYVHISPKYKTLVGIDSIIKDGSIPLLNRNNVEDLENLKYARLLCKIATKLFSFSGNSAISLDSILNTENALKRTRDTLYESRCIDVNRIKPGHEQAVLDIMSKANESDLKKMNSLYISIDYLKGRLDPMMISQNESTNVNKIVADSVAKLHVALNDYNSIIDRIGLMQHLKN